MAQFLELLRSGDWVTRERMRIWAICVLAMSAVGVLFLLVTSDGLNDTMGRPLGSDFSNVYAAGTYVLDGHPAAAFDWPAQFAREKTIFGEQTQFYGWHYPPFFLFVAGMLATMPYTLALAVWQGVTFALYLFSVLIIVRSVFPHSVDAAAESARLRIVMLLAVAFPAMFVNLTHGHNGFLTAALIGSALALLDRRPVVAGLLFGLMSYKPQFGVLIPLVLIASGRWRCFISASVTVIVLVVATTVVFGADVWRAFFESTHLTRVEVLEAGATGWHKIQSVFAWMRMWGGSVALAYAVQGAVTLGVAGALIWLWRSGAAFTLLAGALALGAILATPYSLDYDMMVLAPAIALFAADGLARGFAPWEKTALAFLWFAPLISRSVAQFTFIPLGTWSMLLVFVLVVRRAAGDCGAIAPTAALPTK